VTCVFPSSRTVKNIQCGQVGGRNATDLYCNGLVLTWAKHVYINEYTGSNGRSGTDHSMYISICMSSIFRLVLFHVSHLLAKLVRVFSPSICCCAYFYIFKYLYHYIWHLGWLSDFPKCPCCKSLKIYKKNSQLSRKEFTKNTSKLIENVLTKTR
jgi:hypothetical protein